VILPNRPKHSEAAIAVDPRVPAIGLWPREGIAGRIGVGRLAGAYVFAESFDDRVLYCLHLPEDNVYNEAGDHIMDNGVTDELGSETGGLIDLLTVELDIVWFVDPATVERASAIYWPKDSSS
jgi:hypothetical protein